MKILNFKKIKNLINRISIKIDKIINIYFDILIIVIDIIAENFQINDIIKRFK